MIRLEYASNGIEKEATLLVKTSSILLKYIVCGAEMALAFSEIEDGLLFALKVYEGNESAALIWSVMEFNEERDCLRALFNTKKLQVFLFNELALNVSWKELEFPEVDDRINSLLTKKLMDSSYKMNDQIRDRLDLLHKTTMSNEKWVILNFSSEKKWNVLHNHLASIANVSGPINIFDSDEGTQQETIAAWLTNELTPAELYRSPQIIESSRTRELTDLLLSYELGSILIESKALGILARARLPSREKLRRQMRPDIRKAFSQLKGAITRIKKGVEIKNKEGRVIKIVRDQPIHAVVLVPELDLVVDGEQYGTEFIRQFMAEEGGYPHILDVSELLRVVQSAETISKRGSFSRVEAFDFYLLERLKKAVEAETLCIEVILREQR